MTSSVSSKPRTCDACPARYDPCLSSGGGDKPAHIIVVGVSPSGFSIGQNTPFHGKHGRLFKKLLDMVRKVEGGQYSQVRFYRTYAVLVGAYEPKTEHIECCKVNLFREINTIPGAIKGREPVVVALGDRKSVV